MMGRDYVREALARAAKRAKPFSRACSLSHLVSACFGDFPLVKASSSVAIHARTAAASFGAYRGWRGLR
jgi:hypothetical protein